MKEQKHDMSAKVTQADSTSNEKVTNPNAHSIAFLLMILAIFVLIAAFWMCFQTMGTNLLLISSSDGQLYRQYPVFLLIGILLLIVSIGLYRKNPANTRVQKTENTADESTSIPVNKQTDDAISGTAAETREDETAEKTSAAAASKPEKLFCTQCGKELTKEMRFCTQCGTPVNGETEQ